MSSRHILDLPLKIRYMVYGYTTQPHSAEWFSPQGQFHIFSISPTPPTNTLRVCEQFHAEIMELRCIKTLAMTISLDLGTPSMPRYLDHEIQLFNEGEGERIFAVAKKVRQIDIVMRRIEPLSKPKKMFKLARMTLGLLGKKGGLKAEVVRMVTFYHTRFTMVDTQEEAISDFNTKTFLPEPPATLGGLAMMQRVAGCRLAPDTYSLGWQVYKNEAYVYGSPGTNLKKKY